MDKALEISNLKIGYPQKRGEPMLVAGPMNISINHGELIELLLQIFGKHDFKYLSEQLAMLIAFEAIERNKNQLYRSKLNECYLKYQFDINKIISIFRNISQKYYQDRIYEYYEY